jgi:hypothetical protein
VLGQTGTLVPIVGLFVGGASTLKLFYDWNKELTLKCDGTTSKDVHYTKGMDLVTKLYCLRVKKKGVGGAENFEGQIKVEGVDSDYYTTQWYKESNPSVLITMDEKYLKLFEVIEIGTQKKIRFYSVSPQAHQKSHIMKRLSTDKLARKLAHKMQESHVRLTQRKYLK